MDFYMNIRFFIYLTLFLSLLFIVNYFNIRNKRILLLVSSIIFLGAILGPINGLFVILLYLFYEYILINIGFYLRRKHGKNYPFYYLVIFFSVLPLLLFKFQNFIPIKLFYVFGVSYMTFKNIEILSENNQGNLVEVLPIDYLSFMLFFPVFMAGPLDKVRRYVPNTSKEFSHDIYLDMCGKGLYRLVIGIFFKFVLSDFFYTVLLNSPDNNIFFIAILNILYIYFEVSGYSSMAIGASYICGITTPENFQRPLLSINIIEFWNSYLITLGDWFKDYLYKPFKRVLSILFRGNYQTLTSFLAIILTFLMFGLWHGIELKYIVFGVYNGILYATTYVFIKKSALYEIVRENSVLSILSYILTFCLVSFGFLIFSGRIL